MKNPVKNRKKDVEMLADSIGIPGTSVSLPVLTLIGNKEMYIENIKSIMGIFSLDLSKPIDLNIHAENDIDTILAVLKPYIV